MVVGGSFRDSTEILVNGEDKWTTVVGKIPRNMYSVRAVSVNNTIILAGIVLLD